MIEYQVAENNSVIIASIDDMNRYDDTGKDDLALDIEILDSESGLLGGDYANIDAFAMSAKLAAGTYYIRISLDDTDGYYQDEQGNSVPYRLTVRTVPETALRQEFEFNDMPGMVGTLNDAPLEVGDVLFASLTDSDDDYFQVNVPDIGNGLVAWLETSYGGQRCFAPGVDTSLELYDPTFIYLGSDDNGGLGLCSKEVRPVESGIHNLHVNSNVSGEQGEGDYFLRYRLVYANNVKSYHRFSYQLLEDFQPAGQTPVLEDVISVPDACNISGMTLEVELEHDDHGDFSLVITSPAGNHKVLKVGAENKDQSGTFIGTYGLDLTPHESLTGFIGEEAQGDWTLLLEDKVFSNLGYLKRWQMNLFCQ